MRLFLIRHGESESNANRESIVEGSQMNASLTKNGHRQAKKLAEWMHGKVPKVHGLYTSSLDRTRETASHLEEKYQISAHIDHRIREGGYCYDTGLPIEDGLLPIKKTVNFHKDPFTAFAPQPPGVESYMDVRTRVGSFIEDLVRNHPDQTVLVVMHGWVLNAFMDLVFNVGVYRSSFISADYTSITYVEYISPHRMGPWRVHFLAQTPHLEVFRDGMEYLGKEA